MFPCKSLFGHMSFSTLGVLENIWSHNELVGGWTNPSEKYARHIESFPHGRGDIKKMKPPPSEVRDFIKFVADSQVLNMEWVKGLILQGCRNISRDGPLKGWPYP